MLLETPLEFDSFPSTQNDAQKEIKILKQQNLESVIKKWEVSGGKIACIFTGIYFRDLIESRGGLEHNPERSQNVSLASQISSQDSNSKTNPKLFKEVLSNFQIAYMERLETSHLCKLKLTFLYVPVTVKLFHLPFPCITSLA